MWKDEGHTVFLSSHSHDKARAYVGSQSQRGEQADVHRNRMARATARIVTGVRAFTRNASTSKSLRA